jgi:glycerol kinase
VPSSGIIGETEPHWFGRAIPIAAMIGDQQGAAFGQACLEKGMAKNTYGTGCFLLANTGSEAVQSQNNLITTVGWSNPSARTISPAETTYCLEASIFMGGATIQWLRDGLQIIDSASQVEQLARQVNDSGDVYLVPAFTGLGAPHWDAHARGTLVGMKRGTGRAHIARAALEAIALQVVDVLSAIERDADMHLSMLRADGGAAANNLLMQMQADLLGIPVARPKVTETTALGAAYLAGLATGLWSGISEIEKRWQLDRCFEPTWRDEDRLRKINRWHQAIEKSKGWANE